MAVKKEQTVVAPASRQSTEKNTCVHITTGPLDKVKRSVLPMLKATDTVLDIGCGDGTFAGVIAPHVAFVTGLESDEGLITRAWQLANDSNMDNVAFHATDIFSWTTEQRYQVVSLTNMLATATDHTAKLQLLFKAISYLTDDGILVVNEPVLSSDVAATQQAALLTEQDYISLCRTFDLELIQQNIQHADKDKPTNMLCVFRQHLPQARQQKLANVKVACYASMPFHLRSLRPLSTQFEHSLLTLSVEEVMDWQPDVIVVACGWSVAFWREYCDAHNVRLIGMRHGSVTRYGYAEPEYDCADWMCGSSWDIVDAINSNITPRYGYAMTGNTWVDDTFAIANKTPDKSAPTILFAPTYNPEISAAVFFGNRFISLIRQVYPESTILIKPHPAIVNYDHAFVKDKAIFKSLMDNWRAAASDDEKIVLVDDPESSIAESFIEADLLIADGSSLIFEFMTLQRPILLYSSEQKIQHWNFNEHAPANAWRHVGLEFSSDEQFITLLSHAFDLHQQQCVQAQQQRTHQLYGRYQDGQSILRVVDFISSLTKPHVLLDVSHDTDVAASVKTIHAQLSNIDLTVLTEETDIQAMVAQQGRHVNYVYLTSPVKALPTTMRLTKLSAQLHHYPDAVYVFRRQAKENVEEDESWLSKELSQKEALQGGQVNWLMCSAQQLQSAGVNTAAELRLWSRLKALSAEAKAWSDDTVDILCQKGVYPRVGGEGYLLGPHASFQFSQLGSADSETSATLQIHVSLLPEQAYNKLPVQVRFSVMEKPLLIIEMNIGEIKTVSINLADISELNIESDASFPGLPNLTNRLSLAAVFRQTQTTPPSTLTALSPVAPHGHLASVVMEAADKITGLFDGVRLLLSDNQQGDFHTVTLMGVVEGLTRQSQTGESVSPFIPELFKLMGRFKNEFNTDPGAARQTENLFLTFANELVKEKDNYTVSAYRRHLMNAYHTVQQFYKGQQPSAIITSVKTELYKQILSNDYQLWIKKHEIREVDAEILAERMVLHWQQQPVMHCMMFVLPDELQLLADTIDALAAQLYSGWQLTVIAAGPAPDPIFDEAASLHWRTLAADEDPYAALNNEIARYPEHWLSFIEPGLQYASHGLAKIADAINLQPEKTFFYTDDDLIDAMGTRSEPRFKPDFNLDLLRASPYIGNSWMKARQLIELGGVSALAGAENYDLALRWFERFDEQAFYHVTDVLTHKSIQVDRPFDAKAGTIALQQHFERLGIAANIHDGYVNNSYRIEYLHTEKPLVSIIIPTKDKLEFLQPCVESLLDKTSYENYEVLIVDNQSQEPDTFAYYEQLQAAHEDKVRVLNYDKPFNFSAINNWAAAQARGEFLILLNNDTEIIQPKWIDRLLNHGQREGVGIVGARLFYPESGLLQHAGVVIGLGKIADHPYNNLLGPQDYSPMERARLDQNYSAVTAAMLLVKRDVYEAVNGLDEDNLAVLFNDVDFCLRVGEAGYRVVWTPFAMGVHHGSSSLRSNHNDDFYTDWEAVAKKKERTRSEQRYFMQRWKNKVVHDPAFNPNLSLVNIYGLSDINAPLNWERQYHLRLRCFGVPINGASGDYRMRQPFDALAKAGKALCETGNMMLSWAEVQRLQPDTLVVQNAISDDYLAQLRMYREFNPDACIIFLLDDLLHDLPEKSSQYRKLKAAFRDARSRLRQALSYCDKLIVSTQPLRELCQDMIDDIHIVPNRLMQDKWSGLTSLRATSEKPRVGWAGAQQHQGDLEMISDVVKETASEVDWIFFGMCPDEIRAYVKEVHDFVDIEEYPAKLASLNLDLAIAPLEMHNFNEAKSNLRLLEYGMMGWPVLCTDIYPYQTNNAPVTRVPNDKTAWVAAIRQLLADPAALQNQGDKLQRWVQQHYLLESHLDEWLIALTPSVNEEEHEQYQSVIN